MKFSVTWSLYDPKGKSLNHDINPLNDLDCRHRHLIWGTTITLVFVGCGFMVYCKQGYFCVMSISLFHTYTLFCPVFNVFVCLLVYLFVCLFVWSLREFFSYGDVTITGERLQILPYARHSWPLSSEGSLVCSLACKTCCDMEHPFIMVISEGS